MIEKWGHLSKQWHGDPGSTKLLTLPGWKKNGTRSWSTQWKLEPWQRWIYHEGNKAYIWGIFALLGLFKNPASNFVLFPLKVPSSCISFSVFTKAMEEISPVLELLPKAEMRRNTWFFLSVFPFLSDFLLVLLIGQTQPQASWHGSLDQISGSDSL